MGTYPLRYDTSASPTIADASGVPILEDGVPAVGPAGFFEWAGDSAKFGTVSSLRAQLINSAQSAASTAQLATVIIGTDPNPSGSEVLRGTGNLRLNGNVVIGNDTVDPIVQCKITGSNTGASFNYGQSLHFDVSGTGDSAGYDFQMTTSGSGSRNHICPVQIRSTHNGTGTMTYLYGMTIADTANSGAGTVTYYYGVDVQQPAGTGVLTNVVGVHVRDLGTRGATTTYAVMTDGTTPSLFGGTVITYTGLLVGSSAVPLDPTSGIHVELAALTGTTQFGSYVKVTGTSGATSAIVGQSVGAGTAASAYTTTFIAGSYIRSGIKGSGSTVSTAYGLYIEDQTVGATNYAIYTGAGVASVGGPLQLRGAAAAGTANTVFLGNGTQSTVGANGAASALTANPLGYLIAYLGSTKIAIPYYNG